MWSLLSRKTSRALLAILCLTAFSLAACQRGNEQVASSSSPAATSVKESTQPAAVGPTAALANFNRAAAMIEKYQYADSAELFQKVVDAQPDWTAARFNLALALLNMQKDSPDALPRAEKELLRIVDKEPNHLPAHFCLGVYYKFLANESEALKHLAVVHEKDPNDPYAAFLYADVLAGLKRNDEAAKVLEQVVDRDPGFISGVFRLGNLYNLLHQRDKAAVLFKRFGELKPQELAVGSFLVGDPYAAKGKYYTALGPDGLPLEPSTMSPSPRILFRPEVRTVGAKLTAWESSNGPIQVPGVAVGDLDNDGDQDLVVCGTDEKGSASIWLNDGKAGFAQAGAALIDQAVSPCLGDIDDDGDLDLWLGRAGGARLFLNDGKGAFSPASQPATAGDSMLSACARLLDLDSDGDLDLLASRAAKGPFPADPNSQPAPFLALSAKGDGSFQDIAEPWGLALADQTIGAFLSDDLDNDRDIDLVLLPANGRPLVWENHRVGKYRLRDAAQTGLEIEKPVTATTGDPFRTGRRDILVASRDQLALYRNRGGWKFEPDAEFAAAHGKLGGTCAQFVDIDNDGDLDLLIADAHRSDSHRGPELLLNQWPRTSFTPASAIDRGLLLGSLTTKGDAAAVAADFNADGTPDVLILEFGQPARLVENATQGGHWLALDLEGKRLQDQTSRTSHSAIGARVEVRAGTLMQQLVVGTPAGPSAMPPLRLHVGLGNETVVPWLRVQWPDSILQAELDVAANQILKLPETCRRTASCPHLFAWDGERFAFVSDFGGVGGLGYLTAPNAYAPPDPDEYVRLPKLEPRDGDYVLQVVEPLEEVVYFDEAKLVVVDHPAGTKVLPNEMAAVGLGPPEFELFCHDRAIDPVSVTNHRDEDVTAAVLATDRRYAGATDRIRRFTGYAQDHYLDLDFGDRLSGLIPKDRLVLTLDGWVEYSTSTSNYAAGQAGMRLKAPSLFVERGGQWVELFHEAGYPAGINHVMTLDLQGKLQPGDHRFRLTSNMDICWDRIAILPIIADAPLQVREIGVRAADVHYLGYPREYSPDGRLPNLLDYNNVDRSQSWLRLPGAYTRYGEVTPLVEQADDRFVIMASGDELTLRFPAGALGPVAPGQERTLMLKATSYCKDMDLYTGASDRVEPLPYRGMSSYPPPVQESSPFRAGDRAYGDRENTRVVEP